jgi:hypothetical protein
MLLEIQDALLCRGVHMHRSHLVVWECPWRFCVGAPFWVEIAVEVKCDGGWRGVRGGDGGKAREEGAMSRGVEDPLFWDEA